MELIKQGFFLFLFIFFTVLTQSTFATVPISGRSLQGATAAEARLNLIATAESFLGTPYRFAGIDRRGLDCSGLVYLSFRESLNLTVPRTSQSLYNWVEKIETAELQPGDLVFFITAGTTVSHLGIYAGGGRFIHSASEGPQTGVMYSSLNEAYWRRTYIGAGRALPWDADTNQAMIITQPAAQYTARPKQSLSWSDPGFFVGIGAAWTWGGFFAGSPSAFRGISSLVTAGYKWSRYRAGLELRQEWDRALGVFRLPLTISLGTDTLQVFAGPAYTFGDPSLSLDDGERYYSGGGAFNWGFGVSSSFPPIRIGSGALSLYGEMAWQSYPWLENDSFNYRPDLTANFRISTGLRYLWKLPVMQ